MSTIITNNLTFWLQHQPARKLPSIPLQIYGRAMFFRENIHYPYIHYRFNISLCIIFSYVSFLEYFFVHWLWYTIIQLFTSSSNHHPGKTVYCLPFHFCTEICHMSDAQARNLCVWVRIRQPPDGTQWPQTAGWLHVGPSLLSQLSWDKPPASPLPPKSFLPCNGKK